MSERVGQITIDLYKERKPEISIKGMVPPRTMNGLQYGLRVAYRKHLAAVRRGQPRVDMADKGRKVEDMKPDEVLEPVAEPSVENMGVINPPPSNVKKNDFIQDMVANITKNKEKEDGNDEGSEGVREDAEQSRSEEGSGVGEG